MPIAPDPASADPQVIADLGRALAERTAERDAALERQRAVSEVLQVISRSAFDLVPVLETVIDSALRLCRAHMGSIFRLEDGAYHWAVGRGLEPAYQEIEARTPIRPGPETLVGRVAIEGRSIQIPDAEADPHYAPKGDARIARARTMLGVPLLREGVPIGVIAMARDRVEPFSDNEVALVSTFADQAVIAIENARLLGETREALDQQTATAEVLQVINASPGELAPVFNAMLERAMRLCEAKLGFLSTYDGQLFEAVATYGVPKAYAAEYFAKPYAPAPGTTHDLLVRGEEVVHIPDLMADPLDNPRRRAVIEMLGVRTILGIALRREGELVGALHVYRQEVRPFTDKQIALLQNFAAQAVIAMENARLLDETREALEQQTATAEVLQVINASPGDLAPVFDAMLERASRLCEAPRGQLAIYDGEFFRFVAVHGDPAFTQVQLGQGLLRPELGVTWSSIAAGESVVHIVDVKDTDLYRAGHLGARRFVDSGRGRTLLTVGLRRDDTLLGALTIYRQEVRAFTDKQIALLQNFAQQAVIAMENARLLGETRRSRDAAEAAYRDLQAAQASIVQSQKMAALGQLTAGIAHEIKNPLNFVNNFAALSNELLAELKDIAAPAVAALPADRRAEFAEIAEMLSGNLDKVVEHGRRADNIVKSMLEHSRGVSGERREVDLNALIEEALNLAYHGARAQDQSFNITLERDFDPALAPIEVAPQEMTRVFLNLFGNGFYAAHKRRRAAGNGFSPVLRVKTRELGEAVEVRVRDNGTGIPPDIRDKLFQPFFTTKPSGEGTGLGLSISYDIVAQQHGGAITVDSEEGAFTEFTVRLPRRPPRAEG